MASTRRGHPDVFTEQQNAMLRAALRELQSSKSLSQATVGEMLNIGQQSAGRLLNDERSGFSYASATRLVRHLRFAGVDSFFRSRGVALDNPHEKAS